ncbi:hypothetical protein A1O1_04759 [Capronia coronata CBS 617.96]|uniref:Fe2OG dioxygenase domain-containing protein n=1 Tax=Capronia coronata CBS 617.96 TaxID=1182541 RepID=W9Y4X0_9EURO|nr:uncharacterized protein A1O1_04759 [Capronia coronata CBS 617.96]EXJ87832.1 hypothetical protein A1O1_04759 [Capronia coronata CBS 617.96]
MAGISESEFTPHIYPPFPVAGISVASLPSFKLSDLAQSLSLDSGSDRRKQLLRACHTDGCFYLDVGGDQQSRKGSLMKDAESLVKLLQPIFKLSQDEKDKYSPSDPLALFGYKKTGVTVVDADNTPDCAEFFNLSKDDLSRARKARSQWEDQDSFRASQPEPAPAASTRLEPPVLAWPRIVHDHQDRVARFMCECHEICLRVLDTICTEYGFPPATLRNLHNFTGTSGDHLRLIRGPAGVGQRQEQQRQQEEEEEGEEEEGEDDDDDDDEEHCPQQIHTPSHCDFGTVTLLFNWLGGLQIEQDGEFKWVKPVHGHAIVLVGSALGRFTENQNSGISCHPVKHRVVSAPGAHGRFPRYAMAYLLRPEDDVLIKPLDLAPPLFGAMRSSQGDLLSLDRDGQVEVAPNTAKEWIRSKARELGIGETQSDELETSIMGRI